MARMAANTLPQRQDTFRVTVGGVMLQWRSVDPASAKSGVDGGSLCGQLAVRALRSVVLLSSSGSSTSPPPPHDQAHHHGDGAGGHGRASRRLCVRAGMGGGDGGALNRSSDSVGEGDDGSGTELCLVLEAAGEEQAAEWVHGLLALRDSKLAVPGR